MLGESARQWTDTLDSMMHMYGAVFRKFPVERVIADLCPVPDSLSPDARPEGIAG